MCLMTQKIINTYYNPQEKKLKTSFNTFIAIKLAISNQFKPKSQLPIFKYRRHLPIHIYGIYPQHCVLDL